MTKLLVDTEAGTVHVHECACDGVDEQCAHCDGAGIIVDPDCHCTACVQVAEDLVRRLQ